jgi:small subunit ribosomal protein S9
VTADDDTPTPDETDAAAGAGERAEAGSSTGAAPTSGGDAGADDAASEETPADGARAQADDEQHAGEEPAGAEAVSEQPDDQPPAAEEPTAAEPASEQPDDQPPAAEEPAAEEPASEQPAVAEPAPEPVAETEREEADAEAEEEAPRVKPSVPGAHLEVDIVPEGEDPLGRIEEEYVDPYAIEDEEEAGEAEAAEEPDRQDEVLSEPIATAAIDLAAGARYRATGKRKTAIARVTLRPGTGSYVINGRSLEQHFPRATLQRNIRQPLETVGYQERMDVVARLHGGGISAQAGALRHGVSRALLEADPNLRGELKRRGFLTRDSRAKERKKAGLKKARKRPQFSKR